MNNRYLITGLAAALLILSACAKNNPPSASGKPAVATVNGKPVDADAFDAYLAAVTRKPASEAPAEQRAQALDQFIAMQLAAELAVKNGMDKTADVASQLTLARMNVLSEAALKKYMDEHPSTDAEIKGEYDTQVAAMGRQYHARHILVESKVVADGIIEKLKGGADFAKLAEKESSDGSAKQGGDLGWFALSSMVPAFGKAVAQLDKGKYTLEPVQTQYGWHIIKLEDYRSPEPPAFDQVKEQVKGFVQRKKVQSYLEELRKGAKIDKPAAASAPAAPAEKPAEKK
jgi:peptidyl-prolyl cis-trans isomerase C